VNNRYETIVAIYRLIVMWAGTTINVLFGSADGMFLTLIAVMVLDSITGVFCAVIRKKRSGRMGMRAFAKKMGILCIVSLATLIEQNILETTAIRSAVILYYISSEGLSIFENLSKIGVPIPKKLKDVLDKVSEKDS
jgi:toxin secretion/phage lysis holin